MKKINVMVIDDSALIRHLLSEILRQFPEIGQVESATDPIFALKKMEKMWPDVIVLDIEMPRMNGIEFSRKIMHERPTPIVIVSSKTEKNMALGVEALKNGALELIHKPETGLKDFLENSAHELFQAIKAAASSNLSKYKINATESSAGTFRKSATGTGAGKDLIAIGASTGGTHAIEKIMSTVDFNHGPIVITQHMPSGFTAAFAERLDRFYLPRIYEGSDNQRLENGSVYIAPGGRQMQVLHSGEGLRLRVSDDPPVNRHRPSVDVLFDSVAQLNGQNILAILLTGMGADGARGLLNIRRRGGHTIAQDAESCVVFGMPAEAIALGAAEQIRHLDKIGDDIRQFSLAAPV